MSGFEVLRSLRLSKVNTPILILSGISGIEDKVNCLGFGADDYLTKPYHKTELIARIHAIVRRSQGHPQSVVQIGDLTINVDAKTVHVGNVQVHLNRADDLLGTPHPRARGSFRRFLPVGGAAQS
jgi:two-component system cell cycle response regulator CtrA